VQKIAVGILLEKTLVGELIKNLKKIK